MLYERGGKRLMDVVLATFAVVLGLPVMLGVALGIRIADGRPVLFRQVRSGFRGRPFRLLKFRTMRERSAGPAGAQDDDARLTWLGRRLRATSLDELPTLWNVLKGEMSLVGPRPLLPRYLDRYTEAQARRLEVRPGITGWAQVNGRNALTWEEKFDHDVWYVDHAGFWLDLRIMVLTVFAVLRREGISAQGHATMPEFMGTRGRDD